jgi:hypothetical protein
MEAATPLRFAHVAVLADRLVVDGLTIDDPAAVGLVRARLEAGQDPVGVVARAIEVGARVLDREQAGSTAEHFRADLERSVRDFDTRVAELEQRFDGKVNELFGADAGLVTRAIQRHFGEESAVAVQHQVRKVMEEVGAAQRENLLRQFSSADGNNPLADFKQAQIRALRQLAQQQDANLRAMQDQMTAVRLEVQKLQAEKEKAVEVAAEHDRSTAKGRPYEQAVFEAIDEIARRQGDDCDAVGDEKAAGGKKGDVVVAIDGACGPARGRIVIEAKNSQESKKKAVEYLAEAMVTREADYGIWVVPSEDKLPARTPALREVAGDKLFVVYDPDEGTLALEVAYSLARARALMARGAVDGLDAGALRAEVERALGVLEDTRRIKAQLTTAANGIDEARKILEAMAATVRGHLERVDALLAPTAE